MRYTVTEFRKNTREILNQVEAGREVLVERHGNVFKIIPWVQKHLTDDVSSNIRPDVLVEIPGTKYVERMDGNKAAKIDTVTIPKLEVAPPTYKQPNTKVPDPFDETKGIPNTSETTRLAKDWCKEHDCDKNICKGFKHKGGKK